MNGRKAFLWPGAAGAWALALSLVLVLGAVPAKAARWHHRDAAQVDLILEGGVVTPYGDLGDNYFGTEKGAGAETGFDVGARLRQRWPSGWALSPSFHYEEFGDFVGNDGTADRKVSTSILRYALDLQYFFPTPRGSLTPFLSAGAGLYVNRYRDQLSTEFHSVLNTFNALGISVGGGVRAGSLELAVAYHFNRFSTARLPGGNNGYNVTDYDWDFLSVSAGFALPLGD
jgi:hypothetical protein